MLISSFKRFLWHSKTLCRIYSSKVKETRNYLSTIYALASGHGKCGVAVIRVSGPGSSTVLERIAGSTTSVLTPRKVYLKKLCEPNTKDVLDKGLILWFPGPHSYTGEDCCELHVHGGLAVVSAVLRALSILPNTRPAEPGEFTKRAFMNGKLDLTEVEGLADLIHAETEVQRKQALRQATGQLSQLYTRWREMLVKCSANLHAFIDFSEDDNIEPEVLNEVRALVNQVTAEVRAHLSDGRRGERLRAGVRIAIVGQPNVGKSSLLNLLCQRPAAIVSPIPGTTRDVVETHLDLGGYPVIVSDTAGIRDTSDVVEVEGVRRARLRALEADLKVILIDAEKMLEADTEVESSSSIALDVDRFITSTLAHLGISEAAVESATSTDNSAGHTSVSRYSDCLFVLNKIDLLRNPVFTHQLMDRLRGSVDVSGISCVTQLGLADFLHVLTNKVQTLCANPSDVSPSLTQARHRHHLTLCLAALEKYGNTDDLVLAGHELQKGLRHIGKLTGKVTSEEILDVIFRDFCIGK